MQGQPCAVVDHPIALAPGEQLNQFARTLERRKVFQILSVDAAAVERPEGFIGLVRAGVLRQSQGVFGEVWGDARVDKFDLAGLALEGGIQAAAEDAQVAAVERAAGVFAAGELGEKAVAVGQLVDQHAPLGADLAHLPLAAAVEHRQLAAVPVPVAGQALQQQALPALAVVARWAAEFLVDLEVQAAANQLQALMLATGLEVFLQAAVDHDIGVELIDI